MHLVSPRDQAVTIPGIGVVALRRGRVASAPRSAANTTGRASPACSGPPGSHGDVASGRRPLVRPRGRGAGMSRTAPRALGRPGRQAVRRPGERLAHAAAVGAEVEFIPVEASTGRRSASRDGPGATLPFLRRLRGTAGMAGEPYGQGHALLRAACWRHAHLRAGRAARVQLAGLPSAERAAGVAARDLRRCARRLARGDRSADRGLDPPNPLEGAPLLLTRRYDRMAEYLASASPPGAA